MKMITLISFVSCLVLLVWNSEANVARPEFHISAARVKRHFVKGSNGDLVEGEEHLRKVILIWHDVTDAKLYEICHQCRGAVDESTGIMVDPSIGRTLKDDYIKTCGGKPCIVMPAAPLGYNRFHMRYQNNTGDWSPWSRFKNFNVQEPGHMEHEELTDVQDAARADHEEL
eukprot:CAMPEP_0178934440 /NCGR_PEP_ID=MMETSP0786-20121207/23863_1 /TAXON_ID=186022 /ORGANISM="Thalassionema frauenfeldii, Strain CCMP 1798" /LENGTH=170 /DNA_ID=CAMNT_0020612221 /DNA_START=66 /DNA_END=578 /DNA_ORIENTATION=+